MTHSDWTVLVPVEILEGETVSDSVVDLLATCPVVVLGYHVLPEQTPPGQARLQFEDQAQAHLENLAAAFREAGGDAETRLVFTHDEEQTLDRVADETGCTAILTPNPTPAVEALLVSLRGEVNVARIADFVSSLVGDRDISVTLFDVVDSEEGRTAGETVLDDAAAQFRDCGIPGDAITTDVTVSRTPVQAIATAAADHHAVVMSESAPSLRSLLFGEASEQVAARSLGPVISVRRESVAEDSSESSSE